MKIYHFNAQSIVNKIQNLKVVLTNEIYDCILVTETWLSESKITNAMLSGDGKYQVFRRDRPDRNGGGILMLIRSCYSVNQIEITDNIELICVDLHLNEQKFRIICIYRPPNYNLENSKILGNKIISLSLINFPTILCGDFNLPDINWTDKQVSPSVNNFQIQNWFLQLFTDNNLSQYVTDCTRKEKILDLVFCNHSQVVKNCHVEAPFGTSDHNTICFTIEANYSKPVSEQRRNFSKGNYNRINFLLANMNWDEILKDKNSDEMNAKFVEILNEIILKHIPLKKKKTLPFSTTKLKKMRKLKLELWKKRNEHNGQENYSKMCAKYHMACKMFAKNNEKRILSSGNIKSFYNFVNNSLSCHAKIPPLKNGNGELKIETSEKCEILADQFHSVFTQDNGNQPEFEFPFLFRMQDVSFQPWEIWNVLKSLQNKSSCNSPDKLPAVFLKKCALSIAYPISLIYTKSYETGKVPTLWKMANVCPIYKAGTKSEPANYRPISLTSILAKTMEKIIKTTLVQHLKSRNIISEEQFGFMSGRSTVQQLIKCNEEWIANKSSGIQTDVVFLDFAKAFDKISHKKLQHVLWQYGIRGRNYYWIKDYLTERKQSVLIEGKFSSEKLVLSSVPQGSVLGPILFNIYISSLIQELRIHAKCAFFADDGKIWLPIKSVQDCHMLQNALQIVSNWSAKWQMNLAAEKCYLISFGNKVQFQYTINGTVLKRTETVRDLGIWTDENFLFRDHIKKITKAANNRANYILRSFSTHSFKYLIKSFTTYVRSMVEYGTELWSPHKIEQIDMVEKVQRCFTKRVYYRCKLPRETPYLERCKMANLKTLEFRRKIKDLSMYYQIYFGQIECIQADQYFLKLDRNRRTNDYQVKMCTKTPKDEIVRNRFFERTSRIWNKLPNEVFPQIPKLETFLQNIDKLTDLSIFELTVT